MSAYNRWSGRIAPSWEERLQRVEQVGRASHLIFDTYAGRYPGSMVWPGRYPPPPGWSIVDMNSATYEVTLLPEWWAPPVRVYVVAEKYARWGRLLGGLLPEWWRARPH